MLYTVNGNAISASYNVHGNPLSRAYDVHGNQIGGAPLKVMNYNVGQWYIGTTAKVPVAKRADYFNLHNGIFSRHNADVLILQEALNKWCDDGSTTESLLSPYFDDQKSWRATTNYQGHYICTKGYQMTDAVAHPYSANKGNYPAFESVKINVGGRDVYIVNAHNDYVLSYQKVEIPDLLNVIKDFEYFIMMGDFNVALTETTAHDTTQEQYIYNIKPFLDAGYNVGNGVLEYIPTYFATSSPTGGELTDNVITSPNITIDRLYADTTKLTDSITDKIDHIPLIAEVTIY